MLSKIAYEHVEMIVYKDDSMHVYIYKYVYMNVYKQTIYLDRCYKTQNCYVGFPMKIHKFTSVLTKMF
jgi:hypothetical protein